MPKKNNFCEELGKKNSNLSKYDSLMLPSRLTTEISSIFIEMYDLDTFKFKSLDFINKSLISIFVFVKKNPSDLLSI